MNKLSLAAQTLTKYSPWCSGNHMLSIVQLPDVLTHVGPTNAGVTLNVHVVPQSKKDLKKHKAIRTEHNQNGHTWYKACVKETIPFESVLRAPWLEQGSAPESP